MAATVRRTLMLPPENSNLELNGVPLEAIRVVDGENSVRPLLRRLLGKTRIVRDLSAATQFWRETGGEFHFVTLTGEILSAHGIFTGGHANGNGSGKAPASILGRKNQIGELQGALAKLQEDVAGVSRRKGALQSEQTALQASLQEAQTELRTQEVAIATREGEFNALQNSQRLLHQKIETVVYEVQTLAAQEQEGLQKRAGLSAKAEELETRERDQQIRVTELTHRLEELRQQRDSASGALTESKVSLATEEQMSASYHHQEQSLEQRTRELKQIIDQRRGELGAFVTRKEQAEREILESRAQMDRLRHERDQVNEQAGVLVEQKQAQESGIATREEKFARTSPSSFGYSTEAEHDRSRIGAEEHVGAKPARTDPAEVSFEPGRRPQRVHYDYLRRGRSGKSAYLDAGRTGRCRSRDGLDRDCAAGGNAPATIGRNGPGESGGN